MQQGVDEHWAAALRRGDYERAWQISDAGLRALNPCSKHEGPRHQQRIWRGERIAGRRVLVRCYHGLGDTIQFARFFKPLGEVAADVTVWCQPVLVPLMRSVPGVSRVLPLHDGEPESKYDVDIEVMELAHALRADAEMIGNVPYLRSPLAHYPRCSKCSLISVGLVWQATNWDMRRSMPAALLSKLAGIPGVVLFSLQQGTGREDAPQIPAEDIAVSDFSALAARIESLDLIITVDTMMAHLAGALGAPVWTMLHKDCDWRWPLSGSKSAWYPTMRLFHQPRAGVWATVIDELVEELRKLALSRQEVRC